MRSQLIISMLPIYIMSSNLIHQIIRTRNYVFIRMIVSIFFFNDKLIIPFFSELGPLYHNLRFEINDDNASDSFIIEKKGQNLSLLF
jgi:hypothetical protein